MEYLEADGTVTNKFIENGQPVIRVDTTEYFIYRSDWDKIQIGDRVRLYSSDEYGGFRVEIGEKQGPVITYGIITKKGINIETFPPTFWVIADNTIINVALWEWIFLMEGDTIELPQ